MGGSLQSDMPSLTEVTAKCLECDEIESNIEVGCCMCQTRNTNNRVRVRVLKSSKKGHAMPLMLIPVKSFICNGGSLQSLPPSSPSSLAVPLKLYGVKKAVGDIGEYISRRHSGPSTGLVQLWC